MLFRLSNVTKTYGPITALRQLTVEVGSGAVGLLGPNGAGKTTLIRTLLGLISVDSGTGEVLGLDIRTRRLDIRQPVGFVPEDECLFPAVPGVEFVAYAGELCGMAPADAMQRAHEVLNYVGLGEARYRPVESYSTGMKQRLKLASAIVHDPKLLILDEPTNGMDPAGRQEMLELARDLSHGKGMSLTLLQPPAARRRGGLRPRHRPGPRRAAGAGRHPGDEAGPPAVVRGAAQGRPGPVPGAAARRWRATPSRTTIHCRVELPEGQTPDLLWRIARRPGRADPPPAAAAQHARRGVPRSGREMSHADLRPGLPALAGPALRPRLAVAGDHPARRPRPAQEPVRPLAPARRLAPGARARRAPGPVGAARAAVRVGHLVPAARCCRRK